MRILIVEDDPKIAKALKKGLEQESYAVDTVYNGDDGLSFAVSGDYDLVILDRMLPGVLDGVEICKAMRADGLHAPVLLLTAKGGIEDRVEGLNFGADDYLVKPFAFKELVARVKALTRRPTSINGRILDVSDLSLDTVSSRVERSGREIGLSSTEYRLLEYMMINKNRILTKDMIIRSVWDYEADILPNTVEVYIGYLRNKIDKPFDKPPLIRTIRGFGYKLEAPV